MTEETQNQADTSPADDEAPGAVSHDAAGETGVHSVHGEMYTVDVEGALPQTALEQRLAASELAYLELENQFKRLAADFDNARRRHGLERENLIKYAGERILERFLEILDNFERALSAAAKATDPQQVVTGVSLIYRQLQDFLTKEGICPMDAKGSPFDPNQHEAVMQVDVDDVPDQTVLEEFRKGYLLNGRVMRPAMVKVANNPSVPALPPMPMESGSGGTDQDSEPANADSPQQ